MSAEYYEDLSRASSSDSEGESSSDEEVDNDDDDDEEFPASVDKQYADIDCDWHNDERCILHVDVDCFYCQCEMLDRNIPEDRPLAIGQKHIIVTCNYAARKYGVKKLELRDSAYAKCPHLLMVDGSDLERYRIHARKVHVSFRHACQRIVHPQVAVAKGAMDEMTADLSVACWQNSRTSASLSSCGTDNFSPYVFGEQNDGNEKITLTEDQTGDSVVVYNKNPSDIGQQHISHGSGGSPLSEHQNKVQRNLQQTACFARQIQRTILQETGFTVTCGISVNPLLSKWAGDLRKPNSVNILYPWGRAFSNLLACMPLRKIPGVGRATLQALEPSLERRHWHHHRSKQQQQQQQQNAVIWTCRDLLRVPRSEVIAALDRLSSTGKSGRGQSRILLQNCRGIDISTVIVDDHGGLPKTVSVENSFKRGSVRTQERVCQTMEDLYTRLPRLLHERAGWSTAAAAAKSTPASFSSLPTISVSCSKPPPPPPDYPTTIRLTARVVVVKNYSMQSSPAGGSSRRRPFVTHSKQVPFDGQAFMNETLQSAAAFLRRCVKPLLHDLVFKSTDIDVTRLNIAVTNFRPSLTLEFKRGQASSFPPPRASIPAAAKPVPVASKSSILGKGSEKAANRSVF